VVPKGRLSAAFVGLGAFGDVGDADDAVRILLPDLLSIRQVFLHNPGSASAQREILGCEGGGGRYGFHDDDDKGALLLCDGGGGAHRLRGSHCHWSTRADKRPGDETGLADAVFVRAVPVCCRRCLC
jgi:hypothetical protein